jgi:hypothetical protein
VPHRTKTDGADLTPRLHRELTSCLGSAKTIRTLKRRASPYMSSFRLDELDVRFADGSSLRLVLKDLSPQAMLEDARRARPSFLYEPRREINAYRWILPHAPGGSAAFYGAATDARARRHWLFLERVNGLPLTQVGEFATWQRAAAWIARFHAAFSPAQAGRLAARAGILVYDEPFYWGWMQRALRFAERDARRRRIVTRIARRYAPVVARLTKLGATIIHGELSPSNVIAGAGRRGRICPVDWEMSALGPGLIDLAALSAGWSESKQRELGRAYLAATAGAPARIRLPRETMIDLDCCRLHLAVRMLGWSSAWKPPRQHAFDWLEEANRLSARLQVLSN